MEGTGSYSAGLTRHLLSVGDEVMEVNRPNRQLRRRWGKTDATDAQAAARAALNGQATGLPKSGNGPVEGIRMLSVARRSAINPRTQAINQLHALVVTAPDQVKDHPSGLSPKARVKVCAAFRPGTADTTTRYAKQALRLLARRYQTLTAEIKDLDTDINQLCARANPALLAPPGSARNRSHPANHGRRQPPPPHLRNILRRPLPAQVPSKHPPDVSSATASTAAATAKPTTLCVLEKPSRTRKPFLGIHSLP